MGLQKSKVNLQGLSKHGAQHPGLNTRRQGQKLGHPLQNLGDRFRHHCRKLKVGIELDMSAICQLSLGLK